MDEQNPATLPHPVWTEGVCGGGAVILRDGVPVPIEGVLTALNDLEDYKAYRKHEDEILRKEREEGRRWQISR